MRWFGGSLSRITELRLRLLVGVFKGELSEVLTMQSIVVLVVEVFYVVLMTEELR